MDRHYKYVYILWQSMKSVGKDIEAGDAANYIITDEYMLYCRSIVLFALKYFNFAFLDDTVDIIYQRKISPHQYIFGPWRCTVNEIASKSKEKAAISLLLERKFEASFNIQNYAANIDNYPFMRIEGNTLFLSAVPSDDDISILCKSLYKVDNSDYRIVNRNRSAEQELRKAISEWKHGFRSPSSRILMIPWFEMLSESEKELTGQLEAAKRLCKEQFKIENSDLCILLSPLRPFDYSSEDSMSITHAERLLHYPHNQYDADNWGIIPISISDLNSFRRIQRVLLEQLTRIDEQHEVCPICGNAFYRNNSAFKCYICEFELRLAMCSKCKKQYLYSQYPRPKVQNTPYSSNAYKVIIEEAIHGYKNIIEFTDALKPMCPFCQ